MPPIDEIIDVLKFVVLLPAVVSAIVIGLFAYARLPRLGIVLAMTLAFLMANEFRTAVDFRIDSDKPLTFAEWKATTVATLTASPLESPPPARYWLPWVLLLAGLLGLIADVDRMPRVLAILLRLAFALFAATLLTSRLDDGERMKWLGIMAMVIVLNWQLLHFALRQHPGLISSATVVLAFQLAGLLLLYAHSARLADIAMILGSATMAIAAIARWRQQSVTAVVPFLATALPALMLVGHRTHSSEVPDSSFLLVAVAPLMLIVNRLHPRRGWALLMLVPMVVAVVLAARVESLAVAPPEW